MIKEKTIPSDIEGVDLIASSLKEKEDLVVEITKEQIERNKEAHKEIIEMIESFTQD